MSYKSPYKAFIFEDYSFDHESMTATFRYSFDNERKFTERMVFNTLSEISNKEVLDRAMQLTFYLAGVSYYKLFPTKQVIFKKAEPIKRQADFLQVVYINGLSQYMFENKLTPNDLVNFKGSGDTKEPVKYSGKGNVVLQSGGKDSLLLATLLDQNEINFTPWYISSSTTYPAVLDKLHQPVKVVRRDIDNVALQQAEADGGLNGHVPITYIVLSYALIQAVLEDKNKIFMAVGSEGEEPHQYIEDLPVNHQWSKTWSAEQLFSNYLADFISPDLEAGSLIRGFSELRIAELFVKECWVKYGHSFSSCNRANYLQGQSNTTLKWCGECPKCANSYLLFAPFIEPAELQSLFGGKDLFKVAILTEFFKGLLDVDGVMKPFECVGETEELRQAYHMARSKFGTDKYSLPFDVPLSKFDYKKIRQHNHKLEPNLYNL